MEKQSWRKIVPGMIPATVVLILNDTVTDHTAVLIILCLMLGVYAAFTLQARTVLVWTLPGIGVSVPYVLGAASQGLGMSSTLASLGALAAFLTLMVWSGLLASRGWGVVGILLVLPWMFMFYLGILNPTYAWLIFQPDSQAVANGVEVLVRIPVMIMLPVLVLRSAVNSRQIGLLALLSLELATLAGIPRLIWMQEGNIMMNAPTLPEGLLHLLTVNQLYVAAMMLPVIGLLALFARLDNRTPPAAPVGMLNPTTPQDNPPTHNLLPVHI